MPRAHVPLPPQWQRVAGFYGAILCIGLMVGLAATGLHATLDALESARNWFSAPHRALGPLPGWGLSALCGAAMTCLALALVRGFAPDTGGSGIPQVVAALRGTADLNWRRVLPVKFIAGILGIGSGMVLGREGPTIHLGGALGAMFADLGLIARRDRLVAIAAGAGAGLAAAFNAPLAGIIFVTEEMRQEFDFSFRAIQSVVLACIAATLVSDQIFGFGPEFGHVLKALSFPPPQTAALLLMLPLGLIIGAMGIVLNGAIVHRVAVFWGLPARHPYIWAALIGGLAGALAVLAPLLAGGGDQVIENKLQVPPELIVLIVLALARALLLVAGYSSGVPGGIFAPMLSIGVAIGLAYGGAVALVLPGLGLHPGLFGVAAMGALFAAMVRAPLTGIVVVLEMTGNIELTFAIMITTLAATFTAEALGGRPIYAQLGKTA